MPELQSAIQPPAPGDLLQWKPLFRWAGVASVLFAVLLIAALVLDFLAPPRCTEGRKPLNSLPQTRPTTSPSKSCGYCRTSFPYSFSPPSLLLFPRTPAIVGTLPAFGILLMATAMTRGPRGLFPRWTAWLGVATGALGVVSEILRHAVPEFYWGYGVLLWVWFIATGVALIRLSPGRTGGRSSARARRTAGRMPGTPPSA